ncbi:hypothetical protein AB0C27_42575 [Nonomuraea sp. NPDC048882]
MSSVGDQKARVVSTLPPCPGRDPERHVSERRDGAFRISGPAFRAGTA